MNEIFIISSDKFHGKLSLVLLFITQASGFLREFINSSEFESSKIKPSVTQLAVLSVLSSRICRSESTRRIRELCSINKSNFIKTIKPLIEEDLLLYDFEDKGLKPRYLTISGKGILFLEEFKDLITEKVRNKKGLSNLLSFLTQLKNVIKY